MTNKFISICRCHRKLHEKKFCLFENPFGVDAYLQHDFI